jgi:hypothetical protein
MITTTLIQNIQHLLDKKNNTL